MGLGLSSHATVQATAGAPALRVLLVEDNPGDAELVRSELEQQGPMHLLHVERVSEALARLREASFDVVLLDLSLPDSVGLEGTRRLHAQDPTVPLVVLTSLEDDRVAMQAVAEGAQDYLIKGRIGGELLLRSMRYAVERQQHADSARKLAEEQSARAAAEVALDALRRSEEAARHAAELLELGDAFLEVDASWRILRVNANQERLSGTPRHESLGQVLWDAWPATSVQGSKYWTELQRCMRHKEPVAFHERIAVPDRWTSVTAYPTGDGIAVFVRDVSAWKRAELRLRAVYDTGVAGVLYWTVDGAITEANDKFLEMTRYTREDLRAGRTDWVEMTPPEWRHLDDEALANLKATGHSPPFEKEFLRKDGTRMPVLVGAAMLDEQRREGVAFIVDITDRKRAEDAVRQSEQLLRQLAETMPQVVWAARPDGTIDYCNRRVNELAGARVSADGCWTWEGMVHPDDIGPTLEAWNKAMATGLLYQITHRLRSADGTWRWHLTRAEPARDAEGRIVRWFGFNADIHADKQAAHEIQEARSKLDAALASMTDAVMISDADGRVLHLNEGFATFHRFASKDECAATVSEYADILDVAFAEGTPAPLDRWAVSRALQGETGRNEVYRLRRKDTGESWIGSYSFAPIHDGRDAIVGAVVVGRDVTDAERAHEQLRAANERLCEEDRRKNEFLGMLSHELRNPLAPIRNALFILDRAEPNGPQFRRAKDIANRQVAHLTRLVDDLLDVTRIARGKVELRRQELDVVALARRAAEDYRALMRDRGIELRVIVPPAPLVVNGDEVRLTQALGNLLHNASKFTPAGGRVTLTVGYQAGEAVIHVRDSGVGMDAETLRNIFEPFVQARQTLARSEGGLGLGLALVKGLVQLHGGAVTVSSAGGGRGTEFVVRLPLDRRRAVRPRAAAHEQQDQDAIAPRRVLVVDDNRDAAESLAELLQMVGHDVAIAYDGPSALARAQADPPDIILCDIGLPGMDGYDLARHLRATGARTRLVAVSGYAAPDDVARATEAGFDAHVAKPPDPEQIARLLA